MTKEEMKNKYSAFITEISEILGLGKPVDILKLCATTDLFFRPLEKRIAELEEKISVLLSCKNCPENKGGFICQKEYEDKCLAQKIQFIKELQEENAKLKNEWQEQVQKATDEGYARTLQTIQLSKAKDIIKNLMVFVPVDLKEYEEAEQFLSEVEK